MITDLDVEYLAKDDSSSVQLRWMELYRRGNARCSRMMVGIVRELDPTNTLPDLEPIDVARGLVSIYDHLSTLGGTNARTLRQRQTGTSTVSNKPVTPTA